jgi:diguanylate cyclase (GGDEF)-like protein
MDLQPLIAHAHAWLGIDAGELAQAISIIVAEIPEIEQLFDTSILEADVATAILEQARELLTIRNLQAIDQMTALRETAEKLEARTSVLEDKQRRDPLTGVYNRGFLDEILQREFANAVAGGWPLSILFADLDRFKQVNDTHGHPTGDSVLVETARLFSSAVRESDFVARYGGEEFLIVLPGLSKGGAIDVGERILAQLRAARHHVCGGSIRVTASLGVASFDSPGGFRVVSDLVEAADRCLYAAKRSGRDRLVCFNPMRTASSA